ncbi:dipeptide ABC transporter ATP-binding protein [Ciceribacter ferrooxidans]|uniref:ABC transporter ATP-binding protein n=1 Tax=Ciceribacter ferrooxidans TaxID=2509717 RepID=A0A4Q2TRT4_9HYPH|nr:ABC transporter ATP-binding protein [Ciceribacter ferrooxidans]RYC23243.1 ABC transporter ATP-binding protein [Ciceribacter ferrooxidans]
MMPGPVLDVRELFVSLRQETPIVENVSFSVEEGKTVCIVGESGSGKSIIANAVLGLLPSTQLAITGGDIRFRGDSLRGQSKTTMRDLRGKRISMIFQDPMSALNPVRKIRTQFDEVFSAHRVEPPGGRDLRMRELLDMAHLPDPRRILDSYPFELSGGQRQRIMISMAMALNPDLLIADEPTTALDVTTQAQILHLVEELQRSFATAVLFITHDFGVVAEIADDVVVLRHGRIVEQGGLGDVLKNPRNDYTRTLIGAVPEWRPRFGGLKAVPIVSARSLRKTFKGRFTALDDVAIDLAAGETLGIVGESGSGKSTFAKCLVGMEEPDAGVIAVHGTDIVPLPQFLKRRHRHCMQMVFQDPTAALNPRHTVGRTLMDVARVNGAARGAETDRALSLLDDVKLDRKFLDRFPHELSGGQRQRVCIARALAANPEVLIADEALSALDVSMQREILDLFDDLKKKRGLAILFITHDLRVAAGICDNIVVMRHGKTVAKGTPAEVMATSRHPYVDELLAAIPGQEWFPIGAHPSGYPLPDFART